MSGNPPSSAGWLPDSIVEAVAEVRDELRGADRRQRWILGVAIAGLVVAIVSLVVLIIAL